MRLCGRRFRRGRDSPNVSNPTAVLQNSVLTKNAPDSRTAHARADAGLDLRRFDRRRRAGQDYVFESRGGRTHPVAAREAIGKAWGEVLETASDDDAFPLSETCRSGGETEDQPGYLRDRTGRRVPVTFSTTVLRRPDGRVAGGMATVRAVGKACNRPTIRHRPTMLSQTLSVAAPRWGTCFIWCPNSPRALARS